MAGKFESQQNKEFIWDLLYNENAFDEISSNKVNEVKDMFETCFTSITNTTPNDTLINKNKNVVAQMIHKLKKMKINTYTNKTPESDNVLLSNKTTEFEKSVEKHKNDLEKQMNPAPPNKPIFSEGIDQPLGNEIDGMLDNMIKNRNLDIKTITDKWVDPNVKSNSVSKKKVTIKDTISLPESYINVISISQPTKKNADTIPIKRVNSIVSKNGGVLPDIQKELGDIKKRLECLEKNKVHSLEKFSPYI